jgi:hypothetical protein
MDSSIQHSALDEFEKLTPEQQAEVMNFMRGLNGTLRGTPGHDLLDLAGSMSPEDVKLIEDSIHKGRDAT